jgi:hypothetical protein
MLGSDILLAHLLTTPDAAAFREAVLALAAERGLTLRPEDLETAIAGARRAWLIRNVVP